MGDYADRSALVNIYITHIIRPTSYLKEALGCLLTKRAEPVFGDNVVNCSSIKLVFRKQIGEDFPI